MDLIPVQMRWFTHQAQIQKGGGPGVQLPGVFLYFSSICVWSVKSPCWKYCELFCKRIEGRTDVQSDNYRVPVSPMAMS